MMQGHSRSGEGKQISIFLSNSELYSAELCSAAVHHRSWRCIALRDYDESVTGDGNPSLLCRS